MSKTLSNHLYELIFSLSSTEKRYVKLFMTKHIGKENQLSIKLFDLILKKEGKTAEEIEKKITFTQHPSRLKNYLYELIIKALEDYHAQKSINVTIRRKINQIELLYNKALYKQAVMLADKTLKLSLKIDNQVFIVETISWYINSLKTFEGKKFQIKIDKLQRLQLESINKLNAERQYLNLNNQAFSLTKKSGALYANERLKQFKEIINNPLLSEQIITNSFISTRCYHSIWANYYYLIKDFDNEYKSLYRVLKLYEDYPLRKDTDQYNYITYLNNYAVGCSRNKDAEQAGYYFDKLREVSPNSVQIEIKIFEYLSCNYLNLLIDKVDLKEIDFYVHKIEQGLKKYENKITPLFLKIIYFNLSYSFILLEDYKKAQQYNFFIINEKDDFVRSDVFVVSKMVQFFLHYKMKNFELLESIYNGMKYYFEQKNINYGLYKHFLTFSKQLIAKNDIAVFKEFEANILKEISIEDSLYLLKEFNILCWIKSEIYGNSFAYYLKEFQQK